MGTQDESVLVVGPSWIGDMVMAQSLFMTLRRQRSGIGIDVLAPAWSGPIVERMPEVSRHIEMPVGHGRVGLASRYRLGRSLRPRHYSRAIVIPRSFKSALVPYFARIPQRTGYRGEMRYGLINDMRILDEASLPRVVQRYVALAGAPGAPAVVDTPLPRLDVDTQNQQRLISQWGLQRGAAVVGFIPGAEYGPAKRWPAEHFAALAVMLMRQGVQVWLFGGDKDHAISAAIASAAPGAVDLAGRTRLQDAVDLIAATDLVVTNDSGLMHVAAATGRRLVALFGSSSPSYTPPLSAAADIVYLKLECSPCFERQCPLGHYRCLRDVSVAEVFERCTRLLQKH